MNRAGSYFSIAVEDAINFRDSISSHEADRGELLPAYQCEDCGAVVSHPGLCAPCVRKFEEFEINAASSRF